MNKLLISYLMYVKERIEKIEDGSYLVIEKRNSRNKIPLDQSVQLNILTNIIIARKKTCLYHVNLEKLNNLIAHKVH